MPTTLTGPPFPTYRLRVLRYPSYGFFVRNTVINATTMFEHWTTPFENSSHNHAWFNSVALFYRKFLVSLSHEKRVIQTCCSPLPHVAYRLVFLTHTRGFKHLFFRSFSFRLKVANSAEYPWIFLKCVLRYSTPITGWHRPRVKRVGRGSCSTVATRERQASLGACVCEHSARQRDVVVVS
jgi:hypothetical protein